MIYAKRGEATCKQVAKDRPHQFEHADLVDPERTMRFYKSLEIMCFR